MKRVSLRNGLKQVSLALLLAMAVTGTAIAQQSGEGSTAAEASVVGVVQVVEPERQTLIVDGRRFSLSDTVNMDSQEMERSEVLRRLSEGDQVVLYREDINQSVIERLSTNLQ